jgi:hypothetical protein
MPKIVSVLDLNKNELRNARIANLASAPSSPVIGQVYFDTGLGYELSYDGTSWNAAKGPAGGDLSGSYPNPVVAAGKIDNSKVSATAAIALSKLAVDPLARTNHTGTQLAVTVSDFDTQVRTSRLDQMAVPTTNLSLNSHLISNLLDPLSPQDAATKNYVDANSQGLDVKGSVRIATTANLTLTGAQTIDGVAVVAGDRVLVKDQTIASANGLYVVATGAWTRAADAGTSAQVTPGLFTFVEEGTSNADSGWVLSTNASIVLGTTALAFVQFSGAGQITAGGGLTKTGNTLDAVGTAARVLINPDSIDIDPAYVGQASITTLGTVGTGTWSATTIALAKGGTGATTAVAARTALGAVGKFATVNGGTTTDTIVHNLNTVDVVASVKEVATGQLVDADVFVTDANTITVQYVVAYAASALRITVIG